MKMLDKEILNVKECAAFLGITPNAVYQRCYRKRIPYYKDANGQGVYFLRTELVNWATYLKIKVYELI